MSRVGFFAALILGIPDALGLSNISTVIKPFLMPWRSNISTVMNLSILVHEGVLPWQLLGLLDQFLP